MCGPETWKPRGGALAALNPPISEVRPQGVCGDLAFHTPGSPESATATHARLTPNEACDMATLSDLYVVIHSSGDLTRKACDCGLFRRFRLSSGAATFEDDFVELPLDKPLSLEVGNDGIIGRRVSLYSRPLVGHDVVVAEGIVGFNFMSPPSSTPSSP
ncbi:hypothetical protein EDB81DRAFT_433839 [Dactylonectria macrodidyma]|uniref:Uncharacterized protein n=1 Tax=Dactylonectria macrodidyma TaxID=307937 RepID=A0A9P9F4P8_9HYPO|nr:hypothetical protein EDB81DRAFT_433839 [Dactylonectria macrodidyma]